MRQSLSSLSPCNVSFISCRVGYQPCLAFRNFGGEKSFEERRGTLERDDNESWEGEERKRRGGCMFLPLPLPIWRVEKLLGRESFAVQPENKGAIHWLLPPAYWHLVLGIFPFSGEQG